MEFFTVLPLGFLIGMGHALEADHLAAVATMLDSKSSRWATVARGAFWGLGHTIALFIISTAVVLFGLGISNRMEAGMEIAVGLMIILLGANLIWTFHRNEIRLHSHRHGGRTHLHLHSRAAAEADLHAHQHRRRGHIKAMGVGLMHGAAGSAGLLVLVVAATSTLTQAMIYFAGFGAGSILGMAAVSAVASYPLHLLQRGGLWLRGLTAAAIGLGAVSIGGMLMIEGFTVIRAGGL